MLRQRERKRFLCSTSIHPFASFVSGEYSCLTVDMTFKRQIAYYLFTIYFPTVIIVFSSWMSFWLDHKSVRVACHTG